MMKFPTQLLILTGIFILLTTPNIPRRAVRDEIVVGGSYSQTIMESKAYALYKGQVLRVRVKSNFSLLVDIIIHFRNSSTITTEYWLNNESIQELNGSFPYSTYGYKEESFEIEFDQIAEVMVSVSYSPEMVYPNQELRDIALSLYPVKMAGKVSVIATEKEYGDTYFVGWLALGTAGLLESIFLVFRLKGRGMEKQKQLSMGKNKARITNILYPFIKGEFLDEIFLVVNAFSMFILFTFSERRLFQEAMNTPDPSIKVYADDIWVQVFFIFQAIVAIIVYGNMDNLSLKTFWSLPIHKGAYVLTAEFMTVSRTVFFILIDYIILTNYTFIVVYGFNPSPKSIFSPFAAHVQFAVLVITISFILILSFNNLVNGILFCTGLLVFLEVVLTQIVQESYFLNQIFVSTSSPQTLLSWFPTFFMIIITLSITVPLVRRFQLQ